MEAPASVTVIFRKLRHSGNVIALFPEIPVSCSQVGACESYMQGGTFGSAAASVEGTYFVHPECEGLSTDLCVKSIDHVIAGTIPASAVESLPLQRELEGLGYKLRVCQRVSTAMHCKRYEAARKLPPVVRPLRPRSRNVQPANSMANVPERPQVKSKLKKIHAKIAGVSFTNDDGSSRQEILSRCGTGEPVWLQRDSDNRYDKRAVKVVRLNGEQLGFLPGHLVGNDQGVGWCIANRMDEGYHVRALISQIGRTEDDQMLGAALEIRFWDGTLEEEPKVLKKDPAQSDPAIPASEKRVSSPGCLGVALVCLVLVALMMWIGQTS